MKILVLSQKIRLKPAQILVLGFAAVILIGTILLSLPFAAKSGKSVGILNAFFTATSAVCVTGLVVVDTYTTYSLFGQLVILILIQTGGLGFMTMATLIFFILGKRITLRERLVIQEALNQMHISGVVKLAKYVITTAVFFELCGAALLSIRFIKIYGLLKGIYYGIFHAVSAFNNAGFDLIGDFRSFTPFVLDPLINIVVMSLIVIGGLGFSVIYEIFSVRDFYKLSLHSKIVITMTAILLLTGFFIFFLLEYSNPKTLGQLPLVGKILAAAFQSVTPRTAGFNTISLSDMTLPAKLFTIFLMFIGASPGSTGGGVKTSTFFIVILLIYTVVVNKEEVEIYNRRISIENVYRAIVIVVISFLLIFSITFLLTITEKGEDLLTIVYEATSAFGTVGLSLGLTPKLSNAGKLLIIILMFTGRVGPLTIAMALASSKKTALYKFPEDRILVG